MMKTFLRYVHFFHHTQKRQIFYRFWSRLKRAPSFRVAMLSVGKRTPKLRPFLIKLEDDNKIDDILNQSFVFLGNKHQFIDTIDWSIPTMDQLWIFNLNYFEFLHVLMTNQSSEEQIKKGIFYIESWIEQSQKYNINLWSPYTISLRLINWISFISFLNKNNYGHLVSDKIEKSIFQQYIFLGNNLEKDIGGNHLFENYKTLILISYSYNDFEATKMYLKRINRLLKSQILDDGVHFEKSISYHYIILNGILDVLQILETNQSLVDHVEYSMLKNFALKMYNFLYLFRDPDNRYPLFGDSNYSMTHKFSDFEDKIHQIGLVALDKNSLVEFPDSGYFRYKDDKFIIKIDAGKLGCDYLMAHAHNDIFNYELIYQNTKIVSDSGVLEYKNGEYRNISRKTASHNTVIVDGIEQGDFFGSFRYGKRVKKTNSKVISNKPKETIIQASYHYEGYTHYRIFAIIESTFLVFDLVKSKKHLPVESFVHLEKNISLEKIKDNIFALNKGSLTFCAFSNENTSTVELIDSYLFEHFGEKIPRKGIKIQCKTNVCFGYYFSNQKVVISIVHDSIEVKIDYNQYSLTVSK